MFYYSALADDAYSYLVPHAGHGWQGDLISPSVTCKG